MSFTSRYQPIKRVNSLTKYTIFVIRSIPGNTSRNPENYFRDYWFEFVMRLGKYAIKNLLIGDDKWEEEHPSIQCLNAVAQVFARCLWVNVLDS